MPVRAGRGQCQVDGDRGQSHQHQGLHLCAQHRAATAALLGQRASGWAVLLSLDLSARSRGAWRPAWAVDRASSHLTPDTLSREQNGHSLSSPGHSLPTLPPKKAASDHERGLGSWTGARGHCPVLCLSLKAVGLSGPQGGDASLCPPCLGRTIPELSQTEARTQQPASPGTGAERKAPRVSRMRGPLLSGLPPCSCRDLGSGWVTGVLQAHPGESGTSWAGLTSHSC